MKKFILPVFLASVSASVCAVDVGVSVSIGQPGFYGQINLGPDMVPRLVLPQPVIIAPAPAAAVLAPIYLHVPIAHTREWHRYCGRYDACGRQVYFVQDEWYEREYVPRYKAHPEKFHHDRHEGKAERRGDGDHDRGRGRGHGKGHDK
jgi:hypothetical protein